VGILGYHSEAVFRFRLGTIRNKNSVCNPISRKVAMEGSISLERPLRADARRNRERVLEAARVCFAREGRDAQIDDIAKLAGVGVGTVYRHFPDKSALMEALLAERFAQFAAAGREALARDDVWQAMRDWLYASAEAQAEDRALCDWVADSVGSERLREILEATGLMQVDVELIARAQTAGAIRPDATAEDVTLIMTGIAATSRRDLNWRRHLELSLDGRRTGAAGPGA
jgi:AcrR family transcriptional regulator